jgi:hypothetical protein
VRHTQDGPIVENKWRNIQTVEGLFIAAKESSWDWLTSYDCLDRVGRHDMPTVAPTSAVRDEPPSDSDGDDDMIWTRDYPSDDDRDLPPPPSQPLQPSKVPLTAKKGNKGEGKGKGKGKANAKRKRPSEEEEEEQDGDEASPDDVHNGSSTTARASKRQKTAPAAAEEDQTPAPEEVAAWKDDKLWRLRRANIDYKYAKNEFQLDSREVRLVVDEEFMEITGWQEETDGRREWHAYRQLSPFSDVDSPPRSPIQEAIIYSGTVPYPEEVPGVPTVWSVVPDGDIPQLEWKHRKCPHQPETCRAWWTHPKEECFIVHSEKTQRSTDPGSDLSVIPPPKTQVIPESGIANYNARLHDHYGMRQPADQVERWPKLGIRVPYEPMTFDANKLDPDRPASPDGTPADTIRYPNDEAQKDPKKRNHIAKDARKRAAYSMRSLDMPLIKTCEPGVRSWGVADADPTLPPPREENGESEDEGDLFHDAYHENDIVAEGPPVGNSQADDLSMAPSDQLMGEIDGDSP